jgi:hypothetical protein
MKAGYWEIKCDGCSGNNMPYMIKHGIWKKVAKETDRFLCLNCVEGRLERKLQKRDFLDVDSLPINNGIFGFHWKLWTNRHKPAVFEKVRLQILDNFLKMAEVRKNNYEL